jgi:hypothetical protein
MACEFEFRLLWACARARPIPDDEVEMRAMLIDGIEWTRFARTAFLSRDQRISS